MTETQELNQLTPAELIDREEISQLSLAKETDIPTRTVQCYTLTEGSPFNPSQHVPPAFILLQFGHNPIHAYTTSGRCRLDQAAAECRQYLIKSHKVTVRPKSPVLTPLQRRMLRNPAKMKDPVDNEEPGDDYEKLIFELGPLTFLCVNGHSVTAYATLPEAAEKITLDFLAKYERPPRLGKSSYVLVKYEKGEFETHSVRLNAAMRIANDQLELLYGTGYLEWHQRYIDLLSNRHTGISIFEGSPGTGKTSYIRHLMNELEATHRFYFIPTVNLDMLSRPDFINFWSRQTDLYPEHQFVVILEDAENALMTRGSDNARMVSAILNLTDGMLADFLRLQFICTINCPIAEIDSALLRPGRLLTHRNVRKLTHHEAQALAHSIGKTLPDHQDYTLAEIFAQPTLNSTTNYQRPRIGFGS